MRSLPGVMIGLLVVVSASQLNACERCRQARAIRLQIGSAPMYGGQQAILQPQDNGAQQGILGSAIGATVIDRLLNIALDRLGSSVGGGGGGGGGGEVVSGSADASLNRIETQLGKLETLIEKRLANVEADVKNLQTRQESISALDSRLKVVTEKVDQGGASATKADIEEMLNKVFEKERPKIVAEITGKFQLQINEINKEVDKLKSVPTEQLVRTVLDANPGGGEKELAEKTEIEPLFGDPKKVQLNQNDKIVILGPHSKDEFLIRFIDPTTKDTNYGTGKVKLK